MTIWLSTMAPITAMQTFALLWFCSRLFRDRFSYRGSSLLKSAAYLLATLLVCLAVYGLSLLFPSGGMYFAFACTLLIQFAVFAALFSGGGFFLFFNLLFANVYFTGVLMTARFVKDALLPRGALPTPLLYQLAVHIAPQCLAIVLLFLLLRYIARPGFTLSPPRFYWLFGYTVFGALYFGFMYTTSALLRWNLVSALSVLLELALVVVCVVFYLMFFSLCRSYHEKVQHTLMLQQYELQRAQFLEIQSANQELRELRHELKNYMFYMNYLIDQGDFDQLKAFFTDFYQKEHHMLYDVSSSASFLDAVLQQKVSHARAQGVDVSTQVLLPEDAAQSSLDLCIVLSNLIDNAVEACRELPSPRISIRIKRIKEYLSVVVENTAGRDVLRQNPLLLTSKREKELHGIGLRVIRQIVDRYDGSIQFESDDTSFKAMLMMKFPAGAEKEVSP